MTLTREFWMALRQALLMIVDALERDMDPPVEPRTSELRKWWKQEQRKPAD